MKTVLIFYNNNRIEDFKVCNSYDEEKIEELVALWEAQNMYEECSITWGYLDDPVHSQVEPLTEEDNA